MSKEKTGIDKCTPGKWAAFEKYSGWMVCADGLTGKTVCSEINNNSDMGESDAKLIAASKDMYEALEKILRFDVDEIFSSLEQIKNIAGEALPNL